MGEDEWLVSEDPAEMIGVVVGHPRESSRVLRLFLAAFWAWHAKRLTLRDQKRILKNVELTEQWAETGKVRGVKTTARKDAVFHNKNAANAVWATISAARFWNDGKPARDYLVLLFRDIFGNPFRPITFNRDWRTSDVMLLANGIYAERAFDRMPILADALQDAGCDCDDILNHLRDAATPHVRGCWALDLVLGKS